MSAGGAVGAVGIVGTGTMGVGIAITALLAGKEVVAFDLDATRVNDARGHVQAFLRRSAELGKLTDDGVAEAMGRLTLATVLDGLAGCDVVIEAIVEDLRAKQELFARLDDVCSPETLFHSNTSTVSLTAIAAGSRHPQRVIGTHYCNPAPLMKLVEVVHAQQTSSGTVALTEQYLREVGKATVSVRDVPGFILNRLLIPFENDCINALDRGIAPAAEIDRAVTRAFGFPMGPFRLLDIVGLDVHRLVTESLYEQLREPRFASPPLVNRMIAEGALGRKAGRGFYDYSDSALFGSGAAS